VKKRGSDEETIRHIMPSCKTLVSTEHKPNNNNNNNNNNNIAENTSRNQAEKLVNKNFSPVQ
jgi:hypothetical protein